MFSRIKGAPVSHQIKVKQVAFNIAWTSIDIIQGAGKKMALISLLWGSNGRSTLRVRGLTGCAPPQQISKSFLLAFPANTLLLMQPDGLVNLDDGSEAGKVSHKVPSIISGAPEFNSACSEVLLIFACGLMRSFLWKAEILPYRTNSTCSSFVSRGGFRKAIEFLYRIHLRKKSLFLLLNEQVST